MLQKRIFYFFQSYLKVTLANGYHILLAFLKALDKFSYYSCYTIYLWNGENFSY